MILRDQQIEAVRLSFRLVLGQLAMISPEDDVEDLVMRGVIDLVKRAEGDFRYFPAPEEKR